MTDFAYWFAVALLSVCAFGSLIAAIEPDSRSPGRRLIRIVVAACCGVAAVSLAAPK